MKKIFFCLALGLGFLFSSIARAELPDYYFEFFVNVDDFDYKGKDAIKDHELLSLAENGPKRLKLEKNLEDMFKKIIVAEKKYYNVLKQIDDQVSQKIKQKDNEEFYIYYERREAYKKTLLREKYGENGGRAGINIRIKNTDFPVLYIMDFVYSEKNKTGVSRYSSEMDYCSPDGIVDALLRSSEKLMKDVKKHDQKWKEFISKTES